MSEQTNIPEFTDADKREADFHNFDEQKEVIGKLVKIEEGSFGKQYIVETASGTITIGTYNVLSSKLHDSDVGKFIKIFYKGNEKSPKTGRVYKDFEVSVKD